MHLSVSNAHFVAGLYGEAFRIDEHSVLTVSNANSKLDANFVTMIAWVRPIKYDVTADRGIIMVSFHSPTHVDACMQYRSSYDCRSLTALITCVML